MFDLASDLPFFSIFICNVYVFFKLTVTHNNMIYYIFIPSHYLFIYLFTYLFIFCFIVTSLHFKPTSSSVDTFLSSRQHHFLIPFASWHYIFTSSLLPPHPSFGRRRRGRCGCGAMKRTRGDTRWPANHSAPPPVNGPPPLPTPRPFLSKAFLSQKM